MLVLEQRGNKLIEVNWFPSKDLLVTNTFLLLVCFLTVSLYSRMSPLGKRDLQSLKQWLLSKGP